MTTSSIPSQLIGTVVLVVSGGKVLLGKRKNAYLSGYYGLPGGRVESTEKLIECASRELTEEAGIKTDKLEYLGVVKEQHADYNFIHFAFLCNESEVRPTLGEPDKCEGWEWFDPDHIPDKTLVGHKAAIDMFVHKDSGPALREVSSI